MELSKDGIGMHAGIGMHHVPYNRLVHVKGMTARKVMDKGHTWADSWY